MKPSGILRLSLSFLALACLPACSLSPIITKNTGDYNGTVEDVNNNVLISNVLRGRDQVPLVFSNLSTIHGNIAVNLASQFAQPLGSIHGTATRPSLTAGPLSVNTNPNFDIAPLNTKKFYLGILNSISENTLVHFIQRGVPPRIVLDLFSGQIDRMRDGSVQIIRSGGPNRGLRSEFYSIIDGWSRATSSHPIKMVVTDKTTDFGPPVTINADTLIKAKAAGLHVVDLGGNLVRLSNKNLKATLCVPNQNDSNYMAVGIVVNGAGQLSSTDKFEKTNRSCVQNTAREPEIVQSVAYQIHMRSVEGMFYYLGFLISGSSSEDFGKFPFYIFDHPVNDTRFSVEYNNRLYYVRNVNEDAESGPVDLTMSILILLNDVVNINRDADELPTTKNVQVVGGL